MRLPNASRIARALALLTCGFEQLEGIYIRGGMALQPAALLEVSLQGFSPKIVKRKPRNPK